MSQLRVDFEISYVRKIIAARWAESLLRAHISSVGTHPTTWSLFTFTNYKKHSFKLT